MSENHNTDDSAIPAIDVNEAEQMLREEESREGKGNLKKYLAIAGLFVLLLVGWGVYKWNEVSKISATEKTLEGPSIEEVAKQTKPKKQAKEKAVKSVEAENLPSKNEESSNVDAEKSEKESTQDYIKASMKNGAKVSITTPGDVDRQKTADAITEYEIKKMTASSNKNSSGATINLNVVRVSDMDILDAYKQAFSYSQAIEAINKKIIDVKNNYVSTVKAFKESSLIKKMDKKARLDIFVQYKKKIVKELATLIRARKNLEQMNNADSAKIVGDPETEAIEAMLDQAIRIGSSSNATAENKKSPSDEMLIEEDIIIQDSIINGN